MPGLSFADFKDTTKLGAGACGEVFAGTLTYDGKALKFAVKRIHQDADDDEKKMAENEIKFGEAAKVVRFEKEVRASSCTLPNTTTSFTFSALLLTSTLHLAKRWCLSYAMET